MRLSVHRFIESLCLSLVIAGSALAGNGACCLPGGICTSTSFEECFFGGGTWLGGTPCNEETCPAGDPMGACCLNDGSCFDDILASQCAGTHFPNQQCSQVNCVPIGACCFEEGGECFETTLNDCNINGGAYQGDGSLCANVNCNDPVGACCVDNGDGTFSCFDGIPQSQCAGQFFGGQTCANIACPPIGACCANGGCSEVTAADCANSGGAYQGDGTTCAPGVCPDPVGACCVDNGDGSFTCFEGPQSQCTGTFFPGRRCDEIACPPLSACCLPDGSCQLTTAAECDTLGGTFIDGGTCNECPPLGACCEGSTCTLRTANVCGSLGGDYQGDGTSCGADTCAVCPCNLDDDDTVGINDLLGFLADWFETEGANVPPGTGADFDGDGFIGINDLLGFLACWFPASAGEDCP